MNNKIPAVEKTIALLELLAKLPEGATQAELKKELGISMSTAYLILQTLLKHKWIRKNADTKYSLDNGLLPLLYPFRNSMELLEHAQKVIDRVSAENEMACKLSIRRGTEQVTIMRAEPEGPFALTGQVGSSFPVIEGSVGAALLCGESDDEIMELIQECNTDLAEKQEPELVLKAVGEVRMKGYAVNLRKNRWNIAAMSMPVRDAEGSVIAAITLIGAESDFAGKKRSKLVSVLKDAVRKCSEGSCRTQGEE